MTGPPETTATQAPTHPGLDQPGHRQAAVVPAVLALGLALAVLVGRDGSPGWQVLRVLFDLDLTAAVDLLSTRPDLDPDRIGAVGLSLGGEQAVGAAAAGSAIDAADWVRSGAESSDDVWVVPGSGHTAGLATAPEQWREHVLGHLDRALLGP